MPRSIIDLEDAWASANSRFTRFLRDFEAQWHEPENVFAQAQWLAIPEEQRNMIRPMLPPDILAIVEGGKKNAKPNNLTQSPQLPGETGQQDL